MRMGRVTKRTRGSWEKPCIRPLPSGQSFLPLDLNREAPLDCSETKSNEDGYVGERCKKRLRHGAQISHNIPLCRNKALLIERQCNPLGI